MKDNVMLKIARCNELVSAKSDAVHACYGLVNSQGTDKFHIPEPWNGHIEKAKVLFVSSNPSIDPKENYPTEHWSNEKIINFFENRFINTPRAEWSKYWKAVNKWTGWIFGKDDTENLLDKYAVLTEIVHCKSTTDSTLSAKCKKTCFCKHLQEIISLFNGYYIVVVGGIAKHFIKNYFDAEYLSGKKIAFVAAPNAWGITNEKRKQTLSEQIL